MCNPLKFINLTLPAAFFTSSGGSYQLDHIYDSPSHQSTTSLASPHPQFVYSHSGNVSAILNRTAKLNCRVESVSNHTVSWIRHKDTHLLTAGRWVMINIRGSSIIVSLFLINNSFSYTKVYLHLRRTLQGNSSSALQRLPPWNFVSEGKRLAQQFNEFRSNQRLNFLLKKVIFPLRKWWIK